MPERPTADVGVDEGHEGGWLYASDRGYLDQLDAYEKFRGKATVRVHGRASRDEYRLTCSRCGKEFQAVKRRKAGGLAYCGPKCRMEAFQERQQAGEVTPRPKTRSLTCSHCGRKFRGANGRKAGRYCGVSCKAAAQNERQKADK